MSKTVYVPAQEHACQPGWTWRHSDGPNPGPGPGLYGTPPWSHDFPPGTVWECDCGQTWVSRGMRGGGLQPGGGYLSAALDWKRESRRARRRRERRAS